MDVQLDRQMVVALIRSPRRGGVATEVDASKAEGLPGFLRAVALPGGAAVAVYGNDTWAALNAREHVRVSWDFSQAESRSSADIEAEMLAALDAPPAYRVKDADGAAMTGAATVIEETFFCPFLAHAPMEPLSCTIQPDADGGVTLHDGCQSPTLAHGALAKVLSLPMEKVRVETLYAGSSFGRRANPDADYHVECALAFAMTDRTRPVKLVWTQQDTITGGYYRPAAMHRVRVGLDASGGIVGWDHRIAAPAILKGTAFEAFTVKDGVDHLSVEGVADTVYAIPGLSVGLTDIAPPTRMLWWRSVGHSHTAFVMESMMDIAAKAAGRDPLEFRLAYLADGNKDQRRLAGVLKLAAEKAGWGKPAAGRSHGIAAHKSFNSYVAEVVEIARDAEGAVKIEKIVCAVDCGVAVNPDVIAAQMEGGAGFGAGHAMRDEITFENGAPVQSNFHDYEPMRISDMGRVETHIVRSTESPTGVGEPGTPPAAPALANGVAAGGPRVTRLPFARHGVDFG